MTALAAGLDESRRLHALDRLQLVGTEREERFDRITRLAQQVFGVPIATVTLVDADRLWFKSAVGMPAAQADRQGAFCDRTIALRRTHVVPDALADPGFAGAPAVAGPPHVRFYAGRPLCAPGGLPVGTLCLFDVVPRSLDDAQLAVLDELGRWTEQELARSEEMERAREVQQALLPGRAPEVPGWEVAGLCLPAAAVGGDLYDLERLDDGLVLTLADVMGKGTGAAILMSGVRSVLRATAQTLDGALDRTGGEARLLTAANRTLLPDLARTGSFVTAFHARVDLSTGVVRYGDAGHGLAVVARAGGGTAHLAADDLPLGIADVEWTEHELQLDPGDTLLVFSDGLLDALGGTREAVAAVADLVAATPEPAQLVRAVRAVAEDAEPLDDVTAVALRRCPE